MDFRYESTNDSTVTGRKQGFVARNSDNSNLVTSYEDWLSQWNAIPEGSY